MEIERKFSIKHLPNNLEEYQALEMEQGYLCNNPIIRIRKSNQDYYMTYKSDSDLEHSDTILVRNEVELLLTREAYELLKTRIEGYSVCKTRYLIPIEDGLTAELDVFKGKLFGLVFAEVEFPDVKAATSFVPPSWFNKELSMDRRFSNYYLSKLEGIDDLMI